MYKKKRPPPIIIPNNRNLDKDIPHAPILEIKHYPPLNQSNENTPASSGCIDCLGGGIRNYKK